MKGAVAEAVCMCVREVRIFVCVRARACVSVYVCVWACVCVQARKMALEHKDRLVPLAAVAGPLHTHTNPAHARTPRRRRRHHHHRPMCRAAGRLVEAHGRRDVRGRAP